MAHPDQSNSALSIELAYERGFWDGVEAVRGALLNVVMPEDWTDRARAASDEANQ